MTDYRQFKLSNNQEIICKILEWDSEETSAIIVNDVLEISVSDDNERGTRFIGFRPWLTHTGGIDAVMTVNSNHVVAETIPAPDLLINYQKTIKLINLRDDIASVEYDAKGGLDEEAFRRMIEDLVDDDDEDAIGRFLDNSSDSDNNIIPFRGPKIFH